MDEKPQSRTVTPDGDAIRRLRLAKTWRVEDLARKAKCSVRTVENIEKAIRPVFLCTLARFATALGVESRVLVAGGKPPPEPPKPQPCVQVQFVLSIPFDQFDESEQLGGFIEFLKKFLSNGGNLNVIGVTPGSTIVTLEMSVDDMFALCSAYSQGQLTEALCAEVRLKYVPKPFVPDPHLKTPLMEGTSKDFTHPKFQPPRRKSKKPKPKTGP